MGTIVSIFAIIGGIGSLVTIVVYWDVVLKIWKKFCKFLNNVIAYLDFPRRLMARRLNDKKFLEWQDNMLLKIYGQDHFTTILNRSYPVYCLNFKEVYDYNTVDSLCYNGNKPLLSSTNVKMPNIFNTKIMKERVESDSEIVFKKELMGNGWFWNGYKWFTARSMRDGNHIGFILDHLDYEGDLIKKIHLSVGDYKLNLLTSHIMTYELYKAYEKFKTEAKELYDTEQDRDEYLNNIETGKLWPEIPFRHFIHHENGDDINKVLLKGDGRYSLLSVQCLVMLCTTTKDERLEYKTFFGKRSSNTWKVSTKLGCYQFPPSGGFDLYDGKDIDSDVVESNCSLKLALMREYLEEIFNDDQFAKVDKRNNDNKTVMVDKVKNDKRTDKIVKMLDEEIVGDDRFKKGTKKAYFSTVGANVDLIDLRLSVNFLLVINDYQYYQDGIKKKDQKEGATKDKTDSSDEKDTFVYNEELTAKNKMLRTWRTVDKTLRGEDEIGERNIVEDNIGERNIVEDSVALYAQGKPAFRNYLEKFGVDEECIARICNDQ